MTGAPITPRLATDAFVLRGDSILLVKRGHPPFAGTWALPGGFVEIGETTEAAVLRELREETGLSGMSPRLLGAYSDPARDPRGHTVSLIYAVAASRGDPAGGDDAAEARFFPVTVLPRLAFDHDRVVRECLPKARSI